MSSREIHVLVIGGSWAGITAVNELINLSNGPYSGLRVTLVEQRTHYFHKTGVIRGLVDPKYADKMFISYKGLFRDSELSNPAHRFVCARLTHVYESSVEVEGGERIPYDYLIIATGTTPTSMPVTQSIDDVECRARYQRMRNAIESSRSILFVGGGAVGIGLCCEIAEMYPKKCLILAHSHEKLLSEDLSGNFAANTELLVKKMGIELILGETVLSNTAYNEEEWVVTPQTVLTKSGRRIPCDLVIWTTRARPYTDFMNSLPPTNERKPLVDVDSGCINVRPSLQLSDTRYPNIFAVGDVNSLPYAEKYATSAVLQAKHAVSNMRILMNESYDFRIKMSPTMAAEAAAKANMASYSSTRNTQMVVALGKNKEVSSTIFSKFSSWASGGSRGRNYMLDKAEKMLHA
ncbi:hypothetical protein IW146_000350 [Coemansia sp. RSA 922]|nr:hypothetical protein LPJ71_000220 [Coemansia sp. S17]KAJ2017108.1 hypothetical protein GGI14_003198 [Coemansia sp. S680]KAJ2053410.1 hypothetical protein H4S04_000699 [Coemansia sp. S16]KAJ2085394.1 hypothetical protein GGI09_006896 [Coemansia sp. S100]KAJ2117908.1 hypothetical protein IW146_000350 [Coemansia sp. RSA 922]